MKQQHPESKQIFDTLRSLQSVLNISEIGRLSGVNLIGKLRTLPDGGKLTAPERQRVREVLNKISNTLISGGMAGRSITTEQDVVYRRTPNHQATH